MATTRNDYETGANKYSRLPLLGEGTIFLAFRDVPTLLDQHLPGRKEQARALDYGCGAGRSTRFLKHIGVGDVRGVDVSPKMLDEAKQHDPLGDYRLIETATDFQPNTFDFAFCSLVLVELESKELIKDVFSEVRRVLKPEGFFLIVNTSPEFFDKANSWLSYDHDFPENVELTSGKRAKVRLTDIDLELRNYYWTREDVSESAQQAGFSSVFIHEALGRNEDPFEWRSEADIAPYTTYILKNR